eukprot:3365825-Karenia_brevis.AAC.1
MPISPTTPSWGRHVEALHASFQWQQKHSILALLFGLRFLPLAKQIQLRQCLVGEEARHDKNGWLAAQPKFSSCSDASAMMPWPSRNTSRSTCGLM